MEIDYALAWDFYDDHDNRPYQLRFQLNSPLSKEGQLIAVVARPGHLHRGHTIAISRANVRFDDVEAAVAGWQDWARITETTVSIAAIRRRLTAAALT